MLKRFRNVASLVVAVAVLAGLFGSTTPAAAAPQSAATIRLAPAVYSGPASGNFVINVYGNTQGQQMRAYEFGLTYDKTKIDILSITEGPFMKDFATANGGSTTSATGGWNAAGNTGTIAPAGYAIAGAGSLGVSGEGIIAVITCQALAATSGGTPLAFAAGAFLADETITPMTPLTAQNSQLWLGEQPPTPDLVVNSVGVVVDPADSTKYKVQATVKNQGGGNAIASSLQVKIDGANFETVAVGPLTIGSSLTVTTVAQATLTPDSDTIDACADSAGVISEIDEGNNCGSYSYSLISDTAKGDTPVNADLKKYISLRAPAAIDHTNWVLKVGANSRSDNATSGLGVKSNGNWTVTAADLDAANTNGKMKEYTGTAFATAQLFDPLHVAVATDVTLPTAGTVQTGTPNVDDNWQDFNTTFSQNVRFRDLALNTTWYHIVVTFAGATSF
jgi:hypothetical protein